MRLMSAVGVLCAALGVLYALFITIMWLSRGQLITGWASLMVVVLTIGGLQMVMLGVVGEYLWRVLDEVRGRPPFVIDERNGFDVASTTPVPDAVGLGNGADPADPAKPSPALARPGLPL